MMKIFAVLGMLALAALAYVFFFTNQNAPPDEATLARLAFGRGKCQASVNSFQTLGVISGIVGAADGVTVQIDPARWEAAASEDKLALATMVYCARMPADGRMTVTVRKPDGEAVFRLINSHVAPWW